VRKSWEDAEITDVLHRRHTLLFALGVVLYSLNLRI
jgi:hypothetical protein